ncbi:MAG: (d)CMP kinase [Armatimonadetes bacterium]|nr:(d)CMP kinase [Armatimonadota bacterium]
MKIAIDGPAGAGKSTVARLVAERLGFTYVDTGAMYRAVALACIRGGVGAQDSRAAEHVAHTVSLSLSADPSGRTIVMLDGADVTEAIRSPEVTELSSPLSALPGVRHALVAQQRDMARAGDVVMEGRDIGTVVLPDAEVKVFLTASVQERARRRWAEMGGRDADDLSEPRAPSERSVPPHGLDAIERRIRERDHRDSTRADSPLKRAEDAIEINTDGMDIAEVVRRIMDLVRGRDGASAAGETSALRWPQQAAALRPSAGRTADDQRPDAA